MCHDDRMNGARWRLKRNPAEGRWEVRFRLVQNRSSSSSSKSKTSSSAFSSFFALAFVVFLPLDAAFLGASSGSVASASAAGSGVGSSAASGPFGRFARRLVPLRGLSGPRRLLRFGGPRLGDGLHALSLDLLVTGLLDALEHVHRVVFEQG